MKMTRADISTRVALAQCCLADLATEVLEAERLGDESKVTCKSHKAYLLKATIDQLKCWRPSIPGGSVWRESFNGTTVAGPTASIAIEFMGYTLLPARGLPDAEAEQGSGEAIASYSSQDWGILRAIAVYETGATFGVIYVEYDPNVITPTSTPITITVVGGGSITSAGDGEVVSSFPFYPGISNADAERLFGVIDSICDCPCTKKGSDITDDTLPKYVRTE